MNSQREFSSEFVINNLSSEKREFLLLKKTRLDVSNLTGVDIVIRGRFIQPKSDGTLVYEPNDRPLHLLITGPSKQNVTLATKRIQELLGMSDEVSSNGAKTDSDDDYSVEEKISCGIDKFPLNFGIKSKILGTNYENVEFIRKETNATITLRGKGSGFERDDKCDEPLYIHVKYNTPGMKMKTRELVLNLVETIQKEFVERYKKYYPCPKKPEVKPIKIFEKPTDPITKLSSPFHKLSSLVHKRPSPLKSELIERPLAPFLKPPDPVLRSLPKEVVSPETKEKDNVDKITIGLSHVPSEFNLKGRIYGPNLMHVKHIEKVSGALILFQGKNEKTEEAPYLLVKYQKPDLKDEARGLIYNLLETVHQDYVTECGAHLPKPIIPRIVPYNKCDNSEKHMKSRFFAELPLPSQVSIRHSSRKESTKETVVPPPPPLISRTPQTKPINHKTNNLPLQLTIVQPVHPLVDSTTSGLKNVSASNFNSNISGQTQPHYSHSSVMYGTTNCDVTPKTSSTSFPKFQYVKKRSHTPEISTVETPKNISNLKPVLETFTTSVTEPEVKKKPRQNKDGLNRCLIPLTPIKQSAVVSVPSFATGSLLQKTQNGRVEPSGSTKDNQSTKNISDTMIFRDNESKPNAEFCEIIDSDDDKRSIILLDDDDKFYRPEKPTPVDSNKVTRKHIGVQTLNQEAWVKCKPIKCQCGHFRQRLVGVRSLAVQTDGYYRY